MTTTSSENFEFTSNLEKPSLSKGTILVNDGTGTFHELSIGSNGQILVSDSAETAGVKWVDSSEALGFGIGSMDISIPAKGVSVYFMKNNSTARATGKPFPTSVCIYISVNTDDSGYSDFPTNINSGVSDTLDFTLGSVAASTAQTTGNWVAYPGGPHFQINGGDINTSGTNFATFSSTLDIDITSGQVVSMRLTNNLSTAGITGYNQLNVFLLYRAT